MAWRDREIHSDAASFVSSSTDPLSSPTDGYFAGRSHPQDMFIDTDAANKGARVKVTPSSGSPLKDARYSEETTPLLGSFVGQGPPPSYLEATTPNPWNGRPSGDEAARLLSFDDRVLPSTLEDPLEGMYKGPSYRRRSFRERCSKKRMFKWIAAILFIIILALILAAVTHKNKQDTIVKPVPAEPALPGESQRDEYPIRWPSSCGKDYNIKTEEKSFGTLSELNVQEAIHQMNGGYKRVAGWIHVAKAREGQAAGTISAKLAYAVSSSVDVNSIKYAWSDTGLVIGDTTTGDVFDGVQPQLKACLGVSVVLYVAPGLTFENVNVDSVHLGMQVHAGVDFAVSNSTSISLTTGTLDASSFKSRELKLETISGSISGKYALVDLISVDTKSGSVNINVDPKETSPQGNARPAVFRANTQSGSLRVDFERKNIPERDYQVLVETTVGSVDGTFIHGSKTDIRSVAGFITADILPFKTGDYPSNLLTSSHSGQTTLKLRSPFKNAGAALSKLTSTHKSISGALDITYPQEWEGKVEGKTLSGTLHLEGQDLELIDQREELAGGRGVEAKKGNGNSLMAFETISGQCDVKVGKL